MAYFLKKTKSKKGIYLQIYQGYYCIEKKQPANKSFKPLGYVDALIKQGIEDPISYFQKEVDILNLEYQTTKKQDKASKITDISLIKKLGYFPIKSINDALKVESSINLIQSLYTPKFDAFNILSNLLYARLVYSNSKYKSYIDTIPSLFEKSNCNLDNIKIALDFFSEEYERITDIYNFHINNTHKFDTSITYFDCTNFYFEIDKKNSNNIISMALLLDKNQIPMSFKLFKANKTKDPIFHEVTKELQERSFVDTKTIYIADNGLKYAKNLYSIINNKDGYIYSKSFKSFNEMEKDWLFNPNNKFKEVKDKDGNLLYKYTSYADNFTYSFEDENGKNITFNPKEKRILLYNPSLAKKEISKIDKMVDMASNLINSAIDKSDFAKAARYIKQITIDNEISFSLNQKAIKRDKEYAGYYIITTSEYDKCSKKTYNAYSNINNIKRPFKNLKYQFNFHPEYKDKNSLYAHFLIYFLDVLLVRLFQFLILKDEYSLEEIFDFFKTFKVVNQTTDVYMNVSQLNPIIGALVERFKMPIDFKYLKKNQINQLMKYSFFKKIKS